MNRKGGCCISPVVTEEAFPLSDLVVMLEGHSDNGIERVELKVPGIGTFAVSHIEVKRDRVVIVADL